jgi:hypothetical protein
LVLVDLVAQQEQQIILMAQQAQLEEILHLVLY